MWTIISCIVIAIIVIVVLTMININSTSSTKNSEAVQERILLEDTGEKNENLKKQREELGSDKEKSDDRQQEDDLSLKDHVYRQALQSFQVSEKETRQMPPKEQMTDGDFRKVLQAMKRKNEQND